MYSSHVSISKITPPRQRPYVLRRPALAKKLRLLRNAQMCVIHAGAGYGKTTAVATHFADAGVKPSWYFIGEGDSKLPAFLCHMIESVRLVHSQFGETMSITSSSGDEHFPEPAMLAERFVRECLSLPKEHIIVLDDYHHVAAGSEADQFVQILARQLPQQIKLVILSRVHLSWPDLVLLAVRGECLVLTTEDLAFTREESETFYADEFDVTLSEDEWERVDGIARGWILALRTFGEKMARGVSVSNCLGDVSDLMHLFEAEIWSKLDVDMQAFLTKAAVFEQFEATDCRRVLGEHSISLLEQAIRLHLFVYADSRGKHSFHPLFGRFLSNKLAAQAKMHAEVNQAAAAWYRCQGEVEQAFACLQRTGQWSILGEWLCQDSEWLLAEGKLDFLYRWLAILPESVREAEHWLYFYAAEVERYRCLYPQAFASYQHFLERCEQKNDLIGQCRGLEGMARVHLDSVQGLRAEELLLKAIQLLPSGEQVREIEPRLYRLLAEIYTNRGDAKKAGEWYQRSQELEQLTEVELESRLLFRTGRLQSAIQLLESKWTQEQTKHPPLTRSYRETSLLLAFVYGLNGDSERGWKAAQTAIQLGSAANSPFVEANGYIRKAHAALVLQDVPGEQIRQWYARGLHMMEELQSTRGKAEALLGLTLLYGREKSLEQALAYGRRGMLETDAIRDDWLNSLVGLAVGIAYAKNGKEELAEAAIQDCSERLRICGDSFGVAICQLWISYLAYRNKDWESFVPAVNQALSLMQSGKYQFLLQRPTMFTLQDVQQYMPVLLEAERRQAAPDYVPQLLIDLGLQNIQFHPGYTLRIQTLGQFRVWLGDKELSDKAWQRGKAKLLFQLLLTKRQQVLPREEILSLLWTDHEEESAIRDFKVALNALNKALEPNRAARANAFFLQRHGSAYAFNLASGFYMDVEEFEKLVTMGLTESDHHQAAIALEKGLAYYQGEYLPDCRYEDWCVTERERLQVLFLRGAERLAKIGMEKGELEQTIRWCEAILRVDDCWEEAYRLLMTAYYQQNNRAQAIRWYEKCVAKLREQLGVGPMPAIEAAYRHIRGE